MTETTREQIPFIMSDCGFSLPLDFFFLQRLTHLASSFPFHHLSRLFRCESVTQGHVRLYRWSVCPSAGSPVLNSFLFFLTVMNGRSKDGECRLSGLVSPPISQLHCSNQSPCKLEEKTSKTTSLSSTNTAVVTL